MRAAYHSAAATVLTAALCIGAVGPAASAADAAGPWCQGALEALKADVMDRQTRISILLDRMVPSERDPDPAPLRRVFVSSRAAPGGAGTREHPFKDIQRAVNQAEPGDRIEVLPGRYSPVEIRISGVADAPITLVGNSDGIGMAEIDGAGTKVRGLISVRGASHVTVEGFRLRNAPRDGIFVEGTSEGERGIRVLDNDIANTGNSAVFVAGLPMRYLSGVDEYRLFDVLVERNQITRTNEPNGVNEAISLGAGVDGFVIRNNVVHDTRQYGIDVKAGAKNGIVTDNLVYGIERHGIYLDAGSRRVANIEVTRNAVFGARNGIVLARESDRDPMNPNLHDISISDNLVVNVENFGIHAYLHPDDSQLGLFADVTIARNCLCGIHRDAVRLGGIRDFAHGFIVRDNLIVNSGGAVWNRIGAEEEGNEARESALDCPM